MSLQIQKNPGVFQVFQVRGHPVKMYLTVLGRHKHLVTHAFRHCEQIFLLTYLLFSFPQESGGEWMKDEASEWFFLAGFSILTSFQCLDTVTVDDSYSMRPVK